MTQEIVDCDVHPSLPTGYGDAFSYLPSAWRQRFSRRASAQHSFGFEGAFASDLDVLCVESTPPDGGLPASSPAFAAQDLLDRHAVTTAILTLLTSLNGWVDPDEAAVMAMAFNRYLAEHWLETDKRFKLAMLASGLDPAAAAADIREFGRHPGVVGVHMQLMDTPMGDRHYYPIYEAAQEMDLPIVYHATGSEGVYPTAPRFAVGGPKSAPERFSISPQLAEASMVSLLWNGVFERFPKLRFVFIEVGFAWLPNILWKLDTTWVSYRNNRPWVKRPPSEYIRDHVRLTTQPFPEPTRKEHLGQILGMFDAPSMLMFATDYPHWDGDNPMRVATTLGNLEGGAKLVERVLSRTAYDTFARL